MYFVSGTLKQNIFMVILCLPSSEELKKLTLKFIIKK